MTAKFETLVVVADGGGARAFQERRRHGPLDEMADWAETAPESERHGSGAHGGTVYGRAGSGRSNIYSAAPAVAAEQKFLSRFADRINRAATAGEFTSLVLIAPPKALGILREGLNPAAHGRIEVSDAHDRMIETADDLRLRLRSLRVPD